jgi:quercetin dioxygenase-like cupin family protein
MSTAASIDVEGFRAGLAADGYEPIERRMPPGPKVKEHTHPFHARLLILEGAYTIAIDGKPVTYGPGDICAVPAGTPHTEEPGPEGVFYIAGRKPA